MNKWMDQFINNIRIVSTPNLQKRLSHIILRKKIKLLPNRIKQNMHITTQ